MRSSYSLMRMKSVAALFLLSILNLICCCCCRVVVSSSWSGPFHHDYFLLAIQWPSGVCGHTMSGSWSSPCYIPYPQNNFTIHGLWPMLNSGANPPPRKPRLTAQGLMRGLDRALVRDLVRVWPQLLNKGQAHPNYEFWAHEWNEHGSAVWSHENAYFNATMYMFDLLDVKNMLAVHGVVPGFKYRVERIQNAAGGLNPKIVCSRDRYGDNYLVEIRFCLDQLGLPVACWTTSWRSCGGSKYNWIIF